MVYPLRFVRPTRQASILRAVRHMTIKNNIGAFRQRLEVESVQYLTGQLVFDLL